MPRSSNPALSPASTFVQQFVEHLHRCHHDLADVVAQPTISLLCPAAMSALDASRHHCATTLYRKHIFYRHQERLVYLTFRLRYVFVHHPHQLVESVRTLRRWCRCSRTPALAVRCREQSVSRLQGIVAVQQLTQFQLDQFNSSSSSIMSTLFRNTTIDGTSTCRASSTCSRVCGMARPVLIQPGSLRPSAQHR